MNYKDIIESKYNRVAWQQLLHDIFLNKVTFREPSSVQVSSHLAKQALYLGHISLTDGYAIAVYEVEMADCVNIERNRRGIRDVLSTDWRNMGFAGAFMFCYRQNESVLRFSYVSETCGFNKQGEYEKVSTDTKRYTYLLGEGRGCHTAVEQFEKLKASKQALSDITDAFSVEALTKQFYKDLFDWYQWATAPESGVTFPKNTNIPDDDRDDIEKQIIRMITRIMFVWFIKQKQLVPECIFDSNYLQTVLRDFDPQSTTSGTYYNAILQNLFFATLNRAIVDDEGCTRGFAHGEKKDIKTLYRYAELFIISEQQVIDLFSQVPFLNGGLFECLDKTKTIDGVEQAFNFDGFSRNDKTFSDGRYRNRATVPNMLFFAPNRGLIDILNRYNFTIEENSPQEQQVALDPELLGKVFENLLGAYNPETRETARNQSGSFYTPREIVNYMVDESLIAYLGDSPLVRQLFDYSQKLEVGHEAELEWIAEKLKAIKILDPACGSGAFPMGLLQRLVHLLQRISPEESSYNLKLQIIENCIYGSDIQTIAAQITKLRFFISLICDCEKDVSEPNFGIPTLPNLETKFVAANSLIAKKKKVQGNLFEDPRIEPLKARLHHVRHEHFMARSASAKIRLRNQDKQLREELAQVLAENSDFAPDDAKQLAAWNPYDQNAFSPFFDPEWMFGVTEGFDIVIGNPPYIQLQNNSGELAKLYEGCNYSTFARTGDIYCLFYERGWQLLKENGHLCYITSNKWMRAGYGEKTRDFFAGKTNPLLLIDFAGVKIFESATVDTNILLFSRSSNMHKTVCAVTNKQNKDSVKNLSVFVQQSGAVCEFANSDSWVILSPIEQSIKRKIEAVGTPLKDWDININRGVLTGYNEAFIISTEKREEILANCQSEDERERTAELIRPILRGRDIKRYGYNWANLWLINTHNGIRGKLERVHIEDYPAIKAHLDQYWDRISKRADKGDTPYNLRNCAYWEDFSKPKIIWKIIGSRLAFTMDKEGYIVNNACYLMTGEYLLHVLAFLNSSPLIWYSEITNMNKTGVGDAQVGAQNIILFPIPKQTQKDGEITSVVNSLLNEYSEENANRLQNLIYDVFGLTNEESDYLSKMNL